MGKNSTDLSPDELKAIITAHFAARGRKVTGVSFGVVQEFTAQDQPTGGHCLQSVRVAWTDAPPTEPNPRTQ